MRLAPDAKMALSCPSGIGIYHIKARASGDGPAALGEAGLEDRRLAGPPGPSSRPSWVLKHSEPSTPERCQRQRGKGRL